MFKTRYINLALQVLYVICIFMVADCDLNLITSSLYHITFFSPLETANRFKKYDKIEIDK